jgi:hypothetical protein
MQHRVVLFRDDQWNWDSVNTNNETFQYFSAHASDAAFPGKGGCEPGDPARPFQIPGVAGL